MKNTAKILFSLLTAIFLAASVLSGCNLVNIRQRIIELPNISDAETSYSPENDSQSEPSQTETEPDVSKKLDAVQNQTAEFDAPDEPDVSESAQTMAAGENSAEIEQPDDSAGMEALSDADGGGNVGLIAGEYGDMLDEGLGSLYECQLGYVYLELSEDYRTVDNKAPEHSLITGAGGYNVAEKRHDTLVDDGWVIRKNPTLIVKCVPSGILGKGVTDVSAASETYEKLVSRDGWNGIGAVINGGVMLVSDELLTSDAGRLLLKLYIARGMYPELFGGLDVDALCAKLLGDGLFVYG